MSQIASTTTRTTTPASANEAPLWAPGAALGAVAAAAMTGPSLFPKDPKLQRIGVVAAAAIGMGIGLVSRRPLVGSTT